MPNETLTQGAPAAQPAATPAPATPAQGVFGPAVQPKVDPAPQAAPAAQPTVPDPSKLIGDFLQSSKENQSSKPDDEVFSRPLFGRYKTRSEAEEAMRRSQEEGKRLAAESKSMREAHIRELADREKALNQLREEYELSKSIPHFKELPKEELENLRKEDPGAYADYLVNKRLYDRDIQEAKNRQAQERENQSREEYRIQAERQRTLEMIDRESERMAADEKNFPMYSQMTPLMERWIDRTAIEVNGRKVYPLGGHEWSPKVAYFLTLGEAYHNALMKGRAEQSTAAQVAAGSAAAQAAAGTAPGGPTPGIPPTPQDDDKAFGDALLKAAPRRVFGGKS